jgi:hypothetical protein
MVMINGDGKTLYLTYHNFTSPVFITIAHHQYASQLKGLAVHFDVAVQRHLLRDQALGKTAGLGVL